MTAPPSPQSAPVLIADIGGTNARFALVRPNGSEAELLPPALTANHANAMDAIRQIVHLGADAHPKRAVLAVAAPMGGESFKLTNGPWHFRPREMLAELGLDEITFLNDFEAQALALPFLAPADLVAIGGGEAVAGAAKLVLGPGTGLGVAALIDAGGWRPIGGEGGHVERAPLSRREREIWRHFSRQDERVDGERILSGPGLLRLYRAVMAADGGSAEFSTPAEVLEAGLAGKAGALETLEQFAVQLGRLAGDLALVFMARGGVYISGGIGLRLAQFLPRSGFRQAFDDKPPYLELMRTMTVRTIIHPLPALLGLTRLIQRSEQFASIGRSWRASGDMNG